MSSGAIGPELAPPGRERGQATVELALCLPVVLTAALLVLQLALVGRDQLRVQQAAREAARIAAVDPSPVVIRAAGSAAAGLDPARTTVTRSARGGPGSVVTVRVRYRSPTDVPLAGLLLPDVVVSAEATMRVEG